MGASTRTSTTPPAARGLAGNSGTALRPMPDVAADLDQIPGTAGAIAAGAMI